MKILVTGGCGYIGTELIKHLLKNKNHVVSIDKKIFGDYLPKHKNLINKKLCVGQITKDHLKGIDTVIHLAAISNDPAAILNSKITWETNVLYTLHLLNISKISKIKKFIFASSGSVYGISKKNRVNEETDLFPLTDYNKTKMIGEKLVENFSDYFKTVILRPGTVCGYSDNIRLDLTVNAMTLDALRKKKVTVNGGKQIRPQLHIFDMIKCYDFFLKRNKKGIFNVGFENYSIEKVSQMIKKNLKTIKIKKNHSIDVRSYRLFSGKLLSSGFKPSKKTGNAILDLIKNYRLNKIKDKKTNLRSVYLSNYLKTHSK